MSSKGPNGYNFTDGCRITHGTGALTKKPFADVDLIMTEFTAGNPKGFCGQLGVIELKTDFRLPRHIHVNMEKTKLADERILVLPFRDCRKALLSTGSFTMVYEYEEPTSFFPTASAEPITDPSQYQPFTGNYDEIRIPKLSAREVAEQARIVFNQDLTKVEPA
ncbi:hypothetical protein CKAH01_00509 [Colletotrichum kahawae]|uniref:Uncharacterized protein n=1 Tax=Colletotrichum kahawae TaxID=34407 RepID=A0AAE0DEN3_COLKA|nr:hypothetical protein CKAH01_00509 [Colletotrichum kahawae]